MKRLGFHWSLLLGLVLWYGSCGNPTAPTSNAAVPAPDSSAYYKRYFEGKAGQCPAWVYPLNLDTAQLVLLHGHKRRLAELAAVSDRPYQLLMNAGMFHSDGRPVGLFINSTTRFPLNTDRDQRGNFFLLPNGVFCVDVQGQARILTTEQFQRLNDTLTLATQSGPMLLIDGQYHPAFRESSTSRHIRNGVGLRKDGSLVFICTDEPTNFYHFAAMFLEEGCRDALYLDGAISGLYIRGATKGLEAFPVAYGPTLGVLL